jgi:hypothetical protein
MNDKVLRRKLRRLDSSTEQVKQFIDNKLIAERIGVCEEERQQVRSVSGLTLPFTTFSLLNVLHDSFSHSVAVVCDGLLEFREVMNARQPSCKLVEGIELFHKDFVNALFVELMNCCR